MDSPKGKTRKKLYLLPHCGDETITYYNKANKINYCNIAPLKCYDGAVPQGYAIGTGWYFISWSFKGITNNISQSWSPPAGKLEKKVRLCPRKWLMLFFLKFQRNNQKNASAMDSAKGKTGEKGCLFTVLWRWNNHTLWQSHSKRMANKLLSHAIRQQKTHKNVISIYYKKTRTIEHGWRFFPWLCHRKRLMLYFLKFQRSNQ